MATTAREVIQNYQPQAELAMMVGVDEADGPSTWYILLSHNATVIELAVLMRGLGCKVQADHTGGGVFCVRPIDPATPAPTTELIHDILTRGFGDRLPALLCKQAD